MNVKVIGRCTYVFKNWEIIYNVKFLIYCYDGKWSIDRKIDHLIESDIFQ